MYFCLSLNSDIRSHFFRFVRKRPEEREILLAKIHSLEGTHDVAQSIFDYQDFSVEELRRVLRRLRQSKNLLKAFKEVHPVFYAFKFRKRVSRVENLRYFYSHLKVLTNDSAPEYVVPETLRLLAWKQSTHNLYNNI